MKTFLAIYLGSADSMSEWSRLPDAARAQREAEGMRAWGEWVARHRDAIVDVGTPLGKTKAISNAGVTDVRNAMTGYVILRAETHEAAARLFEGHPHFSLFPGDRVEVMACLPMPDL